MRDRDGSRRLWRWSLSTAQRWQFPKCLPSTSVHAQSVSAGSRTKSSGSTIVRVASNMAMRGWLHWPIISTPGDGSLDFLMGVRFVASPKERLPGLIANGSWSCCEQSHGRNASCIPKTAVRASNMTFPPPLLLPRPSQNPSSGRTGPVQ